MSLIESITDIRDRLDGTISDAWENRRREIGLAAGALALAGALGLGAYWWIEVRFRPPPSIFDSPVDDVLGYFALDDFSKLPVDERIRFLRDLADRFRGMGQAESATMAAFLAGLSGPAREQATQNARLLAKDILADGADEYFRIPEKDRGKFIDDWVVKWTKMGERIATGKEGEKSDDERLADMRREGERGRQRASERPADRMPSLTEGGAMRFLDFWESDVEKASTPKEQGQIVRFLGDVRKRFGGG
ncbi:MAG: hypothetical protein LW636_02440 [Planctomycetaceae bacterium]|jgi:hypothetical protein|nr:hypothetical protein [Planctomycetaceae bacterium]